MTSKFKAPKKEHMVTLLDLDPKMNDARIEPVWYRYRMISDMCHNLEIFHTKRYVVMGFN